MSLSVPIPPLVGFFFNHVIFHFSITVSKSLEMIRDRSCSKMTTMLPTHHPSVSANITKGHLSHLAGSLSGFSTGSGAGCLSSFTVVEVEDSDFKAFLAIWERKDVVRKRKSQNFINCFFHHEHTQYASMLTYKPNLGRD